MANIIRLDYKTMQEIIMLPENEEMKAIWTTINEHGFIFDKFTLVCEPLKNTYKIAIEGTGDNQTIHMKRIWKDKHDLAHTENLDLTIEDLFTMVADLWKDFSKQGYKAAIGNQNVDILLPFHFMQYIVYKNLHREVEYIEPVERKEGTRKTRRTSRSSNQEYSLTDCIKIYNHKNKNRKKYEYTCEAWPVRGFPRHNKNYTISWVRPYSKGKNRDSLKNTNYKID